MINILNADHLMLIELLRLRTGDLEIGMADLSEESLTGRVPEHGAHVDPVVTLICADTMLSGRHAK